jgi:hypothetical protein
MHGGKSTGAPKGNKNAMKHGMYMAGFIAERRYIRMLLKPLCCDENSERVMTLEVFCETDFRRSLAVLEGFFR